MTRAAIALLAVLTALAGVLGGYWWGRTDGAAVAKARQAAQVVADMELLLDKHAGLAAQSNAAVPRCAGPRRNAARWIGARRRS